MLWIKELVRRFFMMLRREKLDRDLEEEMRFHLDLRAEEYSSRGLMSDDARALAQRRFGNITVLHEESYGAWGWAWIDRLFVDVRLAARQLRSAPGFAALTVFILAFGIGTTTAIFSAVNTILFESLPYPGAGRIVTIWETSTEGARNDGTFGIYKGLAERSRLLDSLAVLKPWQPTMTSADEPERFEGQLVSASYFRVLGVRPFLGRDFTPSDDRMNGPGVVILSNKLWRRRFNADPTIVGRDVTLEGNEYSVIGVMPESFENLLAPAAEVWGPLQYDMSQGRAWGHHLRTIGRLRPGVSIDQAANELAELAHEIVNEQRPETYRGPFNLNVFSLQADITRGVKPALLAIAGAVALVLIVGCVNVTNLLLARGVRRRPEFALRVALGAGRERLVWQLLTEGLFLAVMGGVTGMAVAIIGVHALVALSPPGLPRAADIQLNGSVFAFGFGLTTLVGFVFGVIPALQISTSPYRSIQDGSPRTTDPQKLTSRALVVAEVALAFVLLVSSGLLLRSLQHWFAVDAGFDASHLLTMQVQTSGRRFQENSVTYKFFDDALAAVRSVPGVTMAALTSQLPLSGDSDVYGVRFESSPIQMQTEDHSAFRYAVSPGYIETMRIPLRRGRLLGDGDRAGASLAALINESYANRNFPGIDPIGQRLRIGPPDSPLYTIVGVVGDVKQVSLGLNRADSVYVTPGQWKFTDNTMSLVIRSDGDPAALARAVRAAVWSVDKDQAVVRVATMSDVVAASAAERRFALILFEAFALATLVLAAAGIYGVLTGIVAERTREFGVRTALGASRGNIVGLVVRQGSLLTGCGVLVGLLGAVVASSAIAAMLFGVSRLDPATYAGAIVILSCVSVLACLVPAWRAVRIDPASTLRS
ncbi:MAG TPA: ABC transporter permease [Terriglobia bacterium]|jgi:putative ABC transport system permease protein